MFFLVRIVISLLLACAVLALPSAVLAQAMALPTAVPPTLAVGAALDPSGRLWLAQVKDGRLTVSHLANGGSRFSPASVVTPGPETITADTENRPKIAVGADGIVHVSWTQNLGERMTLNSSVSPFQKPNEAQASREAASFSVWLR